MARLCTWQRAAGSRRSKTILSSFVIPHFLDLKVLIVKAVGATFAVVTGMCLGKEGPFVHISTCAGWLVASLFPKYSENGRKTREMLSVACSAGLSITFGAPIGGVLFSYEARNYLRILNPTDRLWTRK
jgi:chloride channel 3/4/5